MTRPPGKVVINTWDQLVASGGGVAITKKYSSGRDPSFSGWGILRVDAKGKQIATVPKAPYYDLGQKVFSTFGTTRMEALAQAKAWVAKKFGYDGKWTRNRMGDYVPTDVHKRFPIRERAPG